jgi:hypothetical protein
MSSFNKNYTTGDIIFVSFFANEENKTQGTSRWLICFEDLEDEIIVIPLTKNTSQIKYYPDSFIITKESEEGISMGLLYDSLVLPSRAERIKKVSALKNGSCSEDLLDKLNELVK